MARGKKGRKTAAHAQALTEPRSTDTPIEESASGSRKRFTILDYLVVCIFFIAFCYLQKYVALYLLDVLDSKSSLERAALDFFFDTLWKGFIIIAILVGLHDFFYKDVEEEDTA